MSGTDLGPRYLIGTLRQPLLQSLPLGLVQFYVCVFGTAGSLKIHSFTYLFKIFVWLCRVLVAAYRIFCKDSLVEARRFRSCVCRLSCSTACGILVPQPGIEPTSPAVEAQNLNHWTTSKVPRFILLNLILHDSIIHFRGKGIPAFSSKLKGRRSQSVSREELQGSCHHSKTPLGSNPLQTLLIPVH